VSPLLLTAQLRYLIRGREEEWAEGGPAGAAGDGMTAT
jgi:hypothetical protein